MVAKMSLVGLLLALVVLSNYVPSADAEPKFKGRKRRDPEGVEGAEGGDGEEGSEEEGFDTSFCGDVDCYDVLGVKMSASKSDIKAAYRQLSMEWHPDKNVDLVGEELQKATDHFAKIGLAYKILTNKDSREAYDYFIANPEQFRQRSAVYETYAAETDVRLVLLIFISVVSAVQYTSQKYRYQNARQGILASDWALKQAMALMQERGQVPQVKKGKSVSYVGASKVDQEILMATKLEIFESTDIGGAVEPDWTSLFAIQIFMAPVYAYRFLSFHGSWYYRHSMLNQPYDDDEKAYLARNALEISERKWEQLEDSAKDLAFTHEIWESKDNLEKYHEASLQNKPGKLKKHLRAKKKN